jgi:hypothetical protein
MYMPITYIFAKLVEDDGPQQKRAGRHPVGRRPEGSKIIAEPHRSDYAGV